jgi:hypothetical protein
MMKRSKHIGALFACGLLALASVVDAALAQSGEAGDAIEIDAGQLVTLDTKATSLSTLVRELCTKAGVKLRGFEAPDRPVTATYDGVPLRDVLQRLLRDETYMIGVRAGADSRDIEVAWLHVTASKIEGRTAAPVPAPAAPVPLPPVLSTIGAPAAMIVDAISNADEAKRKEATLQLADYVTENPGVLDKFLAEDVAINVEELVPYVYAHEALQTLALREPNPVNRARLDGIAKSLKLRNGGPSKKPTFAELMQQGVPH